jgi:hypothetical protein
MDESPPQLIDEVKTPVHAKPGQPARLTMNTSGAAHATFLYQMNHWLEYGWSR